MYHIYIVEDEPLIRQSMAQYIDWETVQAQVVGTGANGREALEFIIQNQVDLVITDIKMPVMDGIALVEQLVQLDYPVRVILISAYSEFQYAEAALRCAIVDDYVLKPIQASELLASVARAIEKIKLRNFQQAEYRLSKQEMECLSDQSLLEMRFALMEQLCAGKQEKFPAIMQTVEDYFNACHLSTTCYRRFLTELIYTAIHRLEYTAEVPSALATETPSTHSELTKLCLQDLCKLCQVHFHQFGHNTNPLIHAALQAIEEHYCNSDFNLLALSEILNVSPNHLSAKFKQETGSAFTNYLQEKRLEHVKMLLRNPHLRIYEVAEQSGFRDVRYLIKVFRDATGLTPADYRQKSIHGVAPLSDQLPPASNQEGRK